VRFWFLQQPWVEVLHVQRSASRHSSDSWNRFWKISCLKNRTANVLHERSTLPYWSVRQRTIVSQHLSLPAIELLATLTLFSWSPEETSTFPVTSIDRFSYLYLWEKTAFKSGKLASYLKLNYWVNYCINNYFIFTVN